MLGNFPDVFIQEICEQPDALRRAAAGLVGQARTLLELADAREGSVVFTGMGGSYAVCYAPVTVLAGSGTTAEMVDAAELLHYRRPRLRSRDTVVGVSQSGESAETVRLFASLRGQQQRPRLVAITNGLHNSLAGLADIALDTHAGSETGPSTLTFAAALLTLAAVAKAVQGGWDEASAHSLGHEAEATASAITQLLENPETRAGWLREWLGTRSVLLVVGRGTARAAAEMGALTLKEVARFPAESLQTAQFRHGPLELAGGDTAVLIMATEAATRELDVRLAHDVTASGTRVLMVDGDSVPVNGAERMRLAKLDRLLAPAAAIVPCQLLAWALARERGLEPGVTQHASKVTRRE